MSAKIPFDQAVIYARRFAESLGLRYAEAVNGFAVNLQDWCSGAIVDGVEYSPAAQCEWVAGEIAEKWRGGERHAPADVRAMLDERFGSSNPDASMLSMVRKYLGPLPGYRNVSEDQLLEIVRSAALNADHAESFLRIFADGEKLPTPGEIRNTAYNCRSQFEEQSLAAQREEWRRIYGKPDRNWSEKLINVAKTGDRRADFKAQLNAMLFQAITDAIYFTEGEGRYSLDGSSPQKRADQLFWRQGMDRLNRDHTQEVAQVRMQMRRAS